PWRGYEMRGSLDPSSSSRWTEAVVDGCMSSARWRLEKELLLLSKVKIF
uniref:Uncharacterized protein n=1 Tax=Aegilops tauschii subsp. strangulata TaxID=200361 RepID=A0A452XT63_AEGTS